jgi:hypothetical protein
MYDRATHERALDDLRTARGNVNDALAALTREYSPESIDATLDRAYSARYDLQRTIDALEAGQSIAAGE